MGKAKPFLFGMALGASAMFVALQYHVIRSHDGVQILPRVPQQSIGLAYADIRGWTPSQWTDRPELARALMAHGASDLISESVVHSLADQAAEETSTLDDLRTFLNNAANEPASDTDAAGTGAGVDESAEGGSGDQIRIPFPQDARTAAPADPFRVTKTAAADDAKDPAAGSRFSAAEVREGLEDPSGSASGRSRAPAAGSAGSARSRSASEQARDMEKRIFGDPSVTGSVGKPAGSKVPAPGPSTSDPGAMFEEVTSQLESRASEALNRAKTVVSDKSAATIESAKPEAEKFIRETARLGLPGSDSAKAAEPVAPKTDTSQPGAGDFDPFLE